MIPHPPPKISIIVPIFGNSGDIHRLVNKLKRQTIKPYEIILVDSGPHPLIDAPEGTRHLKSPQDVALSWDYNLGAQQAEGDYLLNMQQDCLPESEHAIEVLFETLTPSRVAVMATVNLPLDNWM